MPLHFTSDNQGSSDVREILAAQVTGLYRYVNDSWNKYVQLLPEAGTSITVQANARLRLNEQALSKSTDQPMTLVIMYDDDMELFLAELHAPGARTLKTSVVKSPGRAGRVERPMAEMQSEGGVRPRKRLTLVPAPEPEVPEPARVVDRHTSAVLISPALQDICVREDVHPDLGDYLVIPKGQEAAYEPLQPWTVVIESPYVAEVRVVQPRLNNRDAPLRPIISQEEGSS